MLLKNVISLITQKTGNYVNQTMLADALGITRQTISIRIKNESQITVDELKRIEKHFNIDLYGDTTSVQDDYIYISYYPDVFASCGSGNIVFSDEKIKLPIPKLLINGFSKSKEYSIINALGNSMSPTIDNGDKLIIEHWEDSQIQDDKVYVFCYNNEFFVKRLSKNLDEIIIKSDNKEYRTRTVCDDALNNLVVIGKIVGVLKSL